MKAYFIHTGQQMGPFTLEELRSKNLSPDTPAWHEGLSDWTTVSAIPELRPLAKASPPPFRSAEQKDYEYQLAMEEFFEPPARKNWGMILLTTLVAGGFVVLVWMLNKK